MIWTKMVRPASLASVLCFAALVATGCASGDTGAPAPAPSPSPDKGDASTKVDSASPPSPSAGASCSFYYGAGGCCEALAAGTQVAVDACHQAKKAIDNGVAAGGSAASYEAACKQGIDAARQLGKCN